ncbi:MAG: DUF2325 domain-containing protein [Thermodesulfovibrionales bacterium]
MCVALIGGMDRLEKHYRSEAEKFGIELKVFSGARTNMAAGIRNVDAMVIFTNKISHRVKKEVMNIAKAQGIPVKMYHSCGVCTLRDCFGCLKGGEVLR